MLKKFTNKKGFTLMEMLIVVAIIAILVALRSPPSLAPSRRPTPQRTLPTFAPVMPVPRLLL